MLYFSKNLLPVFVVVLFVHFNFPNIYDSNNKNSNRISFVNAQYDDEYDCDLDLYESWKRENYTGILEGDERLWPYDDYEIDF